MRNTDKDEPFRPRGGSKKRWVFVGAFLVLLVLLFLVSRHQDTGSSKKGEKLGGANHPVPVTVATSYQSDVPLDLQVIGNVASVSSVSLKPQANGPIVGINFAEGDYVSTGQLLFVIDPKPYQAALDQSVANLKRDEALLKQAQETLAKDKTVVWQAKATVKKDEAQLVYAQAEEKRYLILLNEAYVSHEQYEQYKATEGTDLNTVLADKAAVKTAEATLNMDMASIQSLRQTVKGDKAAIHTNQIQLSYCYVHAPFNGRTGSYLVHVGDTVQAQSTTVVNVSQLNPTFVQFAVPQDEIPEIKKHQAAGDLKVSATVDDSAHTQYQGRITFMDNAVDTTTGTIMLRGAFDNPTQKLWPGQFVTVALGLGEIKDATVVPPQAIQTGQKGDYVFVDNDGVAEFRPVTVARTTTKFAAISQGLKPGEVVITDGQLQVEPGFHVKAKRAQKTS